MTPRTYADLIGRPFTAGGRDCSCPCHRGEHVVCVCGGGWECARESSKGLDCYGLVKIVLERNGIPAPDYPSAEDSGFNAGLILAAMEAGWEQVKVPDANCVVVFRMDQRAGTHVGIMVDGLRFLHVLKETGVCVERITSDVWKRRVIGFYRWRMQ